MPIGDSTRLEKIYRYKTDRLPAAISVSSEKSVSTLTNPYDTPQVIVITSDYTNLHHTTKKENTYRGRTAKGY